MPKAAKNKAPPKRERIEKAELFAYAYIRNMGNGRAAATEVYGLEGNSAAQQASSLLTNTHVQKIVGEFLDAQRKSLEKFTEQGASLYTIAVEEILRILRDEDASIKDRFDAIDRLLRLGGFEMSEQVAVAKAQARGVAAGARAVMPGVAAPGLQPGQPAASLNDNRKVIFMLSPPSIRPGGVPTPALEEQWKEMGWKPGYAEDAPKLPPKKK